MADSRWYVVWFTKDSSRLGNSKNVRHFNTRKEGMTFRDYVKTATDNVNATLYGD